MSNTDTLSGSRRMLAAGLGTDVVRVSMVAAHARYGIVDRLERHLRLVSPGVLAALLEMSIPVPNGRHAPLAIAERVALGAAFVAVRRSGNVGWALAIGFPVSWGAIAVGLN